MQDPIRLFRALADETRLQMLAMIRQHRELCVCDLENILGIGQSKASRHLRYLLNAGLVKDRRAAVWINYRIAEDLNDEQMSFLDSALKLLDPQKMRDLNDKLTKWHEQKKYGVTREISSGAIVTLESLA